MKRQSSKRKRIITGIVFITFSLLFSLSILSYSTTDFEPPLHDTNEISNLMGIGGAFVSYYLIKYTFGNAVLIPFILLFLWGWRTIRQKPFPWLTRFLNYSICTMVLISLGLALISEFSVGGSPLSYEYSGLIGGFFAAYLNIYLGKAGTIIVYGALVLIVFVLWSQFPVWHTLTKIERLFVRVWEWRKIPFTGVKKAAGLFNFSKQKRKIEFTRKLREAKSQDLDISMIPKQGPEPSDMVQTELRPEHEINFRELTHDEQVPFAISTRKDVASEHRSGFDTDDIQTSEHYSIPAIELLDDQPVVRTKDSQKDIIIQADILVNTLQDFGVQVKVAEVHPGPVITLYEVRPEVGVKINKILALENDLALAMKAKGIRLIAPIPGKDTVGIEIPNQYQETVYLKSLLSDPEFKKSASKITIALGRTVSGEAYFADLSKMPHLLIAGSTGSGKSVGISTIITSILFKSSPAEVQFIMIDPKMLELSHFKKLSGHHLLTAGFIDEKVITKTHNAVAILKSCVFEMEKRYEILARTGVRNIDEYNRKKDKPVDPGTEKPYPDKLEYIVIIIDELADLMMTASKDVEEPIARLAQMARAVGIHLVLATQRPSVDVITGIIKANFPARIAFQVASKVDSRTILDMNGAEELLGSGDMLYLPPGAPKPFRIQNAFVSQKEIERIVDAIYGQSKFRKVTELKQGSFRDSRKDDGTISGDRDTFFSDAARLVVIHQQGSISLLQRRLKIGYARAARLIDELEDAGIVGAYDGSKARQVLVDEDELDGYI